MIRRLRIPLFGILIGLMLSPPSSTAGGEPPAGSDALRAGFSDPPREARPSAYWLWLNGYVNRDYVESELQALYDVGIRGLCIFDMGARGPAEATPPAGPPFMSDQSVGDVAYALQVAGRLGMDVQLSVASSWDMGGDWVEPRHASMGLFLSELSVEGPQQLDQRLPSPPLPSNAPRRPDGEPAWAQDVAVLAIPAGRRLPGHDFVFQLDPPGLHTLSHAVLYNTLSEDPPKYGPLQLFVKDFSLAVSATAPVDTAFREILRASLLPTDEPQRFDLPAIEARFVRLRLFSGHNLSHDRLELGEFELFDREGINVVASHVIDRSRDGAELVGYRSSLGHDRSWAADNINDGSKAGPAGSWSSAGPPPLLIEDPATIIDLTDRVDADGRLRWRAPPGPWLIMRFVCSNTGERLKVPSPNSDGLATDHLSEEATRTFLEHLVGRLQSQIGDLRHTALRQLYLASYEVRGRIWTPDFLEQFRRYRGYDMKPFLPAISGHVIVSDEATQRFIYDYRKTLGDLLVDAYYRTAADVAKQAGLGIESEAGGPGPPIHQVPVDALKAQGAIDEVRGEFWPKRPDAKRMWVIKETACAAHIYGKRRVHMEAFTSTHHWQDGPWDLKPSADRAFCEGTNHFVWHTSSHLPPQSGLPGWVYGAGTHLNTKLVWWPKAQPFLDYLARCSFLLQQGLFVGDVCYYYGDQGFNFVPPKHIDPSLGFGYDYDVVNREVILTRMQVRDGRLVLPDGMSYALLVLPEREDIDLDVLRKLEQLVRDGATIVGPKPTGSNGLAGYPDRDALVRQMADRLWGPCDGRTVREHAFGAGRIVWGRKLRDLLGRQGIGPDFQFQSPLADTQLDFIHRQSDDADIYFVRNTQPRWEQVEGVFRVQGRQPELWEPDTGLVKPLLVYQAGPAGVTAPLQLAPYGSQFVVFRQASRPPTPLRLQQPDTRDASALATIQEWDDQRATLATTHPGQFRIEAADGRSAQLEIKPLSPPRELAGPWDVRFQEGRGAPPSVRLEKLISWTEHGLDAVRFFSGIAEYRRQFELPADWLTDSRRVLLDLGDLWAVGDVRLNGRPLGVLWKPPYVVDITATARPGANQLMIEIANTWSNRLVGDAGLPASERLTRTNVVNSGEGSWKDTPLLKSGLFGPVRIIPVQVVTARLQ